MRGAVDGAGERRDRVVFARLAHRRADRTSREGFRALLNSFLPRKRAIAQMLVRDTDDRVLLCNLTYKRDWDLPGGVVEVNESPHVAVAREVEEELGAARSPPAGCVLTDWLPPWSGWDDARVPGLRRRRPRRRRSPTRIVPQAREIRSAAVLHARPRCTSCCADFTARRIDSALAEPRTAAARRTPSPARPV